MNQAITPLRQRMIDDMRMRKLAPKTQSAYLLHVRRLAAFLHRPPDTATSEDLRRFQLHMVEQGFTSTTLNVTITGLKFFFDITVHLWYRLTTTTHPAVSSFAACPTPAGDAYVHQLGPVTAAGIRQPLT